MDNLVHEANQRLGDIKKYDCTLGYRQTGITVIWVESSSGKQFNNPLILTVNQSINNYEWYTCIITINNNPPNCPRQWAEVLLQVKGNVILKLIGIMINY